MKELEEYYCHVCIDNISRGSQENDCVVKVVKNSVKVFIAILGFHSIISCHAFVLYTTIVISTIF